MMALHSVVSEILEPAAKLLPLRMDTVAARVMLLAIGQQESRFEFRRQLGNGPARGLWQFERGTRASRGGVWGVFLHEQSRGYLQGLCASRRLDFEPGAIWAALERDDILAACVARLLLWTDPKPLPAIDDAAAAWDLYAVRTWRPGKPHPQTWGGYHLASRRALGLVA